MSYAETALFERLRAHTPFSRDEFSLVIATAPRRYKEHYIEKRHGRGQRLISQPTSELKFIQRLLINTELASLPVHECATGYRIGKSIADHARPHAAQRYLLKMDFKNFFPSINWRTVHVCLGRLDRYSPSERKMLVRLLCKKGRKDRELALAMGAPSSPHISNFVMYEFDTAMHEYCQAIGVTYTRYADDLAFSTSVPHLLDRVAAQVQFRLSELRYLNLGLNQEKTVNVSTKHSRRLTGLVLANGGGASLGRDRKRELRAALHQLSLGKLPSSEVGALKGRLAFALSVDRSFVLDLCARYGYATVADIAP